ncbi:pyridoxal phosphate-dependent transferase, partial [Lactarius indigo]
GMISLFAGKPNAAMFPLTGVQFTAPRGVELKVGDEVLAMGLQYAPTSGIPQMVEWLTEFQMLRHRRTRFEEGWRVSVTAGSQDAIDKVVHALVNRGGPVLIEKPVYAGVIPTLETLLCQMIEVETDADRLVSKSLRNIPDSWPSSKLKPKILYTIPCGCNPTEAKTSLARHQEVIDISREHNILILEEDPYYFR